MFKSTFSKYLLTFVLIILISFLMLSGIISSMIRTYATEEKETQLTSTSSTISYFFEMSGVEDLETFIESNVPSKTIEPFINKDKDINILITDKYGNVLLSTINAYIGSSDNIRHPIIDSEENDLGIINLDLFSKEEISPGISALLHLGNLNKYLAETSIVSADPIVTSNITRGYVVSLYPVNYEEIIIAQTRRAVINSSAWVMLAAIIACYFITERIIHPLKNIKGAVKSFTEGDLSARVAITGKDEIAELGVAFNNMAESLENLEKSRKSFLASVSHDLRTPMTTISGFIDGILSGAIPPEKQDQYLQIISSEVHRLSRLVSQLLDISRLESGDRKMNPETFDIAEVARVVLISFEKQIEDKALDVCFDSEDDEMLVIGDKDAIHQVLYNLCHNAIKFSKKGGRFVISIKTIEQGKVRIGVFDEGQSISPEESKMIFERFYKTDKSRGLDKTGVGLGLYICKTIIDAHGEKIAVESVENQSTEFYFTLKKDKS